MNFEELMLRAVTNAETFKYTAKPNPVVGAILCNDNEIISEGCLLYTSPSPRDGLLSRMPSSA